MTAQPQPVAVQIGGGVNEKIDDVAGQQPETIENARYAKFGALSKRNGYRIDTTAPLPTTPYSADDHQYVATDGDKFVARKTPTGMTFYQRRGTTAAEIGDVEQRDLSSDFTANGTAGRLRPLLTPLPALQGSQSNEGLLCDVAAPGVLLADDGKVYAYVRLEMVGWDVLKRAEIYDIVVEYVDSEDPRLTVREPSRLYNAITYFGDIHRQIRAIESNDTSHGLTIVFTNNSFSAEQIGIYARVLHPGTNAATDVWGGEFAIVDVTATPTTVQPNLTRNACGFDCDEFLHNAGDGSFSVLYGTMSGGAAWARVVNPATPTISLFNIGIGTALVTPKAVALTGLQVGAVQEVAFAVVGQGVTNSISFLGRFNATATGAPTATTYNTVNSEPFDDRVPPHSVVAGRFHFNDTTGPIDGYLCGVNSGRDGFRYMFGDSGQATLWRSIVHSIGCAWATGRPHTFYSSGDVVRVVLPMVSFGGVLGGGAGLLADITPRSGYRSVAFLGAPLLATYAIDEVALSTLSVTSKMPVGGGFGNLRTADWNAGLRMKPIHGSSIPFANWSVPRWLCALGVPPTATMLELAENDLDFEFLEPGVMLVGAGVPLMLDTIHGVSELGFHTSPVVSLLTATVTSPTTIGYAAGVNLQYRFQYRFVDGNGLAQVSPLTDPFLVNTPTVGTAPEFHIAPLDVTLRHRGAVVIDVYRTDPDQATFYWTATVTGAGGAQEAVYVDGGPSLTQLDRTRTPNVENYFMTPPCASHAFRGAFRDIIVTRENELWPSKRRLSTTAPQYDIVDAAAWDAQEPVLTGGEIDGKLILFSRKRIAYTYEVNGTLAPFVDIPSDVGATDGSRAFATHLGVFYQCPAGIRLVGRDLALHEVGLPVVDTLGINVIRGGIKVPAQGEIRLRLDDGRTYLVFDYFQGGPDQPVWYVTRFNEQGGYTDEDGVVHASGLRAIADQAFTPDGRLLYLCRLGFLLEETVGRYRDENQWVPMRVRSSTQRGGTPLTYLASIEGAVNLELPPGAEPGPVTLRLYGDYMQSVAAQPTVTQQWTVAEVEAFDRRQIQITSGEKVMNAPAVAIEYSDERAGDVSTTSDGFGYRLSAMVVVAGPRDPKALFPVANGARK